MKEEIIKRSELTNEEFEKLKLQWEKELGIKRPNPEDQEILKKFTQEFIEENKELFRKLHSGDYSKKD